MKLYYTQPQNKCGYMVYIIYVDKGMCWDEWHDFSDLREAAQTEDINKALHTCLKWLTTPTKFSNAGPAEDYFNEAFDEDKYPESELQSRHPDAVLFTHTKPVHLDIPAEDEP